MRAIPRQLFLVALLATGACFGYRTVETAPRAGARVRIVLASATDVATIGTDGTRRTHADVLEASGIIQASASDTIALRLGEVRTVAGALPGVDGRIALLPTVGIARIEERRFDAGRTALGGVGAAALALTAVLLIIIGTLTKAG